MEKFKPEERFQELKGYFYDYKPDDEDYLEEDPDVTEQIEHLENLNPQNKSDYYAAIDELCSFLREWFPDGVSVEEQQEILNILNSSEEAAKKFSETN